MMKKDPKKNPSTYFHFLKVRTKLLSQVRFLLNALAVILVCVIFFWPTIKNANTNPAQSNEQTTIDLDPVVKNLTQPNIKNQIISPHYTGWGNKGQFLSIQAQKTFQENNSQNYNLENLNMSINLENGKTIKIRCITGYLNAIDKTLTLNKNVHIRHSGGYKIDTSHAIVYYEKALLIGKHPVSGIGPQGKIQAKGFRIENNGDKVILEGQSHVEIDRRN